MSNSKCVRLAIQKSPVWRKIIQFYFYMSNRLKLTPSTALSFHSQRIYVFDTDSISFCIYFFNLLPLIIKQTFSYTFLRTRTKHNKNKLLKVDEITVFLQSLYSPNMSAVKWHISRKIAIYRVFTNAWLEMGILHRCMSLLVTGESTFLIILSQVQIYYISTSNYLQCFPARV